MDFDFIRELFSIVENHGVDKKEIETVENRLAISFPDLLKKYYLQLGAHQDLNQTQDFLILPDKLKVDDSDFLVFYHENQWVAKWGIQLSDFHLPNPPVFRNEGEGWILDSKELLTFLNGMACMQALHAFRFHANTIAVEYTKERIVVENYQPLPHLFPLWNVSFYRNHSSELIALFKSENQTDIFIAAKTEADFNRLCLVIGEDWDYDSRFDG